MSYPVKWAYSYQKISKTEFDIILHATIDSSWVVYDNYDMLKNPDGPIGFSNWDEKIKNLAVIGKTKSDQLPICGYHRVFEMELCHFENTVTYRKRIKIIKPKKRATITVLFEYMTDTAVKCFPPTTECIEFNFDPKEKLKRHAISTKGIVKCKY